MNVMDVSRNQIWTTNNGFSREQRSITPSELMSARTNLSVSIGGSNGNGGVSTDSGHDKSAAISHNLVGVQSKFRRKYYHKVLIVLLVLMILLLLIAIIVIVTKSKRYPSSVCKSRECLRSAASLIYTMDEQIDPCEDFYQFTCGNWPDEHPKPDAVTSNDWFRERQAKVMRTIRHFLSLNVTQSEPEAVSKAKLMYQACVNVDLIDKLNLEPLVQFLKEFKLPLIPSALNITTNYNETNAFNLIRSLVLIKKSLEMDVIIGFDIFPDPANRSVNKIALGTPETESALPFSDDIHVLLRKATRKIISAFKEDDDDDDENKKEEEEEASKQTSSGMTAYVTYMKKIISVIVLYLDPDVDPEEVLLSAAENALEAVKIAKKLYKLKNAAENSTKSSKNPLEDIEYVTITELQNMTDKLIAPKSLQIWEDYLSLMMMDNTGAEEFSSNGVEIITSKADIVYLQYVSEFLLDIPPSQIEFFIWLNVVEELILHTTSDIRQLHSEYMRLIINTEGSTPRSLYCAHGVNSLMGMATSYTLADDDFIKKKLPNVQRMLANIRKSFNNLVRSTTWMDERTKRETLEKSAEMKSYIGFPDWITNTTVLDEHYENVRANKSTHLANMIGVLRWQMQSKLDSLHKSEHFGWATSPSNVNAFHTFQTNTITIPIAILQYPFYDLGLEALNYGAIGTILGHELTHGFDDSGRMFDKNGNMLQWWSNTTINEYVNRTKCFVDQYSRYYLPDIGEYIDGELTLGENIADNGGLREAYHAYRIYVQNSGKEKLHLPGLEKYTHDQLFFISFGNLWCETYTSAASRYALEDSHCPGRIRLKGVLSNSEEFARTFRCRKGSGMYPDNRKCRIW